MNQVDITNVLIVFDEATQDFLAVWFKVLWELSDIHYFVVLELNWSDENSALDRIYLFLYVLSMLEHTTFSLFKLINTFFALLDVLRNWETEPVVIFETLIHKSVQLIDLLGQQLLFNWSQLSKSLIVASEELIQLVDMPRIIFVL